MLTEKTDQLIISKKDIDTLNNYLQGLGGIKPDSPINRLRQEIEQARLIDDEDFPINVVQLYHQATIKEQKSNYKYAYTVVLPEHADHKKCRVSVASALGASLLGRSVGEHIEWNIGTVQRMFVILSVSANRMKM